MATLLLGIDVSTTATKALLMAIMEAQMWCEDPANHEEMAQICSRRRWIHAPYADLIDRIQGNFDYGTGRVVARGAGGLSGTAPLAEITKAATSISRS